MTGAQREYIRRARDRRRREFLDDLEHERRAAAMQEAFLRSMRRLWRKEGR